MPKLILHPNIARPDDVYAQLVALHDGKTTQESLLALSKLVLTLANHIGDMTVIEAAIDVARS